MRPATVCCGPWPRWGLAWRDDAWAGLAPGLRSCLIKDRDSSAACHRHQLTIAVHDDLWTGVAGLNPSWPQQLKRPADFVDNAAGPRLTIHPAPSPR